MQIEFLCGTRFIRALEPCFSTLIRKGTSSAFCADKGGVLEARRLSVGTFAKVVFPVRGMRDGIAHSLSACA